MNTINILINTKNKIIIAFSEFPLESKLKNYFHTEIFKKVKEVKLKTCVCFKKKFYNGDIDVLVHH